jgi:uncharacterized membrane protein
MNMDKKDWHYLLFLLLSHHKPDKLHRTIHINIRGKAIYLCARCTGKYSALLSVFIAWFLGYGFPAWAYFPLFTFLPLPSVVDWFTQSCKLRESKNTIRVCTGFLLGIAEGLVLLTIVKGMLYLFLSALAVFATYVLSIYIIALKTRRLDSYLDEIIPFKQ